MTPRTVSADSHVLEPPDLWAQRVEARYRDRAPRVVGEANQDFFLCEGHEPTPVGAFGTPFARQGPRARRFEETQRGGWDPGARMEEIALDGIQAEVLYPSLAMSLYSIPDPSLQAACVRVYNDWLAEYCNTHPDRLYGIAIIPMLDVEAGSEELRRAAKKGLRGAAIWGDPPGEYSFATDRYDPFWAEAQSLQVPVSLHTFTGKPSGITTGSHPKTYLTWYTCVTQAIQRSLATILFSGVLERFPNLQLVSAENDIGWAAYLLQRMDYAYRRKGIRWGVHLASGLLPSEQFRRQVFCTFMQDRVGLMTLGATGSDILMWASDYPHDDSTWPESQQLLAEMFQGVPEEDKDKIIYSNAVNLYHMASPPPSKGAKLRIGPPGSRP